MDIVALLKASVDRLPKGDHTVGLLSVIRHIDAAVRHFDRGKIAEEDAYTDAIYRANQAFEGSLKEAYRVLTGQDPAGKTPYQIENYLEKNRSIRNRVLVQLTRYRTDYRNPSTHDYKLDFDQDESLLAILAVCAFAKLLVDQIGDKLAFSVAKSQPAKYVARATGLQFNPSKSGFILVEYLTSFIVSILSKGTEIDPRASDFEGTLAGLLSSSGVKTEISVPLDDDEDGESDEWDIVAVHEAEVIPIEVRQGYTTTGFELSYGFARGRLGHKGIKDIVLVYVNPVGGIYQADVVTLPEGRIHLIHQGEVQLDRLGNR